MNALLILGFAIFNQTVSVKAVLILVYAAQHWASSLPYILHLQFLEKQEVESDWSQNELKICDKLESEALKREQYKFYIEIPPMMPAGTQAVTIFYIGETKRTFSCGQKFELTFL